MSKIKTSLEARHNTLLQELTEVEEALKNTEAAYKIELKLLLGKHMTTEVGDVGTYRDYLKQFLCAHVEGVYYMQDFPDFELLHKNLVVHDFVDGKEFSIRTVKVIQDMIMEL